MIATQVNATLNDDYNTIINVMSWCWCGVCRADDNDNDYDGDTDENDDETATIIICQWGMRIHKQHKWKKANQN